MSNGVTDFAWEGFSWLNEREIPKADIKITK
jgi:hypothetical protein